MAVAIHGLVLQLSVEFKKQLMSREELTVECHAPQKLANLPFVMMGNQLRVIVPQCTSGEITPI